MEDHQTPVEGDDESRVSTAELERRNGRIALAKKSRERRQLPVSEFELREAPDGIVRFSGYASLTERPYEVGFFTETIKRGAFKRTLAEGPDVQLLINHGDGGSGMPIARTGRNMTLEEDERGLRVDAELDAEDPDVILLARKMKNGLIDAMSFAFRATDDEWDEDRSQRTIRSVSIHQGDVSVVNQGANSATSAAIRSREALQAVQKLGSERFMALLTEVRASGASGELSSDSIEVLTAQMGLYSRDSEDSDGEIQALLKDFLGVKTVTKESEVDAEAGKSARMVDLQAVRRRRQEQIRRARGSK